MRVISRNSLLQTASAYAVLFCIAGGSAVAQDQGGSSPQPQNTNGGLEEIVVTARKTEEKLMEVPIAISAVSATTIADTDVKTITQLAAFTPGLFAGNFGNGRTDRTTTQLTFRGLSVTSGLVFIDGFPYAATLTSGGAAPTPDLTDVERVEVMEGPQSAYFGRSAYNGAVNYVFKQPSTDEFKGHVSVDLYQYGGRDINASIEGPITDKVAARIGGRYYKFDGQYQNPIQGDRLGSESTDEIHAFLNVRPTDNLTMQAYGSYDLDDDGTPTEAVLIAGQVVPNATGGANYVKTGGSLNCNLGGTGGPYYCGQLPSFSYYNNSIPYFVSVYDRLDPVTTARLINNVPVTQSQTGQVISYPQPFKPNWLDHVGLKREVKTLHLKMDYDFDNGWTVESLTSWDQTKQESLTDQNYRDASLVANPSYALSSPQSPLLPYDAHPTLTLGTTTDAYQEFRATSPHDFLLEGLHGTAGISFLHIENPRSGLTGFGLTGTVQNGSVYAAADTPAIFGGIYYEFIPDVTLAVEAREQWDIISAQSLFPITTKLTSFTFQSFSPNISLTWNYAPNSSVYALFSRGYEPGGINSALIGQTAAVTSQLTAAGASPTFQQQKYNNYEVGIKSTFLDRHVQTTLALYHDIWDQGQVPQTFFVTNATGGLVGQFSVITNIGQVTLNGAELNARVAYDEHFSVQGTADYSISRIDDYVNLNGKRITGSSNAVGKQLYQDPRWTFSLIPQYTDHLIDVWNWRAQMVGTYRDRYYIDATNVAWAAPLMLFDAHLGVEKEDLSIDFYAKNLFNNDTIPEALAGAGESNIIQNNVTQNAIRVSVPFKRTFGLKVDYKFGAPAGDAETTSAAYTPPPVQAPASSVAHSYMVFFDFNKSDLTAQAEKIVDQAAANAGTAKTTELNVTGYTDTVGSDAYNMRLSRRRAESVAAKLEKDGIPSSEIAIVAKGKHDLLVPTADGVKEPQNRRVTIVYGGAASS